MRDLLDGVFEKVRARKNSELSVFIAYSRKDEEFRQQLQTHLSALKLTNRLTVWDDTQISAGEDRQEVIRKHLQTADIVLLLISADFLSSELIGEKELSVVIERSQNRETLIIPAR